MRANSLKISHKIALLVALLSLISMGLAIVGGIELMRADASYSILNDHEAPARVALSRAGHAIHEMAYNASMTVVFPGTTQQARHANERYRSAAEMGSRYLDAAEKGLPAQAAKIADLRARMAVIKGQLDKVAALGMVDSNEPAQDVLRSVDREISDFNSLASGLVDQNITEAQKESDHLTSDNSNIRWMFVIVGMIGSIGGIVGSLILSRKTIVAPLNELSDSMALLADGDLRVEVVSLERADEIGQMARAVQVFKTNGLKALATEEEAKRIRDESEAARIQSDAEKARGAEALAVVVDALGASLERVAKGDLTAQIEAEFDTPYLQLKRDFNNAIESLRQAMGSILTATSSLHSGSDEISSASDDLSRRTEQQAASLEETAAALDEITTTVQRSAEGARRANLAVSGVKTEAERSGSVMNDAVAAMTEIEASSNQITSIIGVIDEIAFQTNLLALNAGVEAARAGEAGRGFAVVAQEVRSLAQRSAEAAREIKDLIASSTTQVARGVRLVSDTGGALSAIINSVNEIDALVAEIALSSQEQATGLGQVNAAVNQMDQVTQQNAAMVEQATAAAASLKAEASGLAALAGRFSVRAEPDSDRRQAPVRTVVQPARPSPVGRLHAKLAVAVGDVPRATTADWQDF